MHPARRRELMSLAGHHPADPLPDKVRDAVDALVAGTALPATQQHRANAISILQRVCTDHKSSPAKLDAVLLAKAMKVWDAEVRMHERI